MLEDAFPTSSNVTPPIINILLFFKSLPLLEDMITNCEILKTYKRLRSKFSFDKKSNNWVLEEVDINIRDHIDTIQVNSEEELIRTAEIISNAGEMDRNKPLWMAHRIQNSNGTSGILIRFHHSIGDGIALVGIMEKLFKGQDGSAFKFQLPERANVVIKKSMTFSLAVTLLQCLVKVLTLGISQFDANTSFNSKNKSQLIMAKRPVYILLPTIRLEFLKEIKKRLGNFTINDILLALAAGTLRRYAEHNKDKVIADQKAFQVRALVPVALPRESSKTPSDHEYSLVNKWAFVSASLPVSERTPRERVAASASTMLRLKSSPMALVQMWFQETLAPWLPRFLYVYML